MNVGAPGHEASRDESIARRRTPVAAALSALCALALLAAVAPVASALPPGRAYEKVSPADKNGNDIQNGFDKAAADGNGATYAAFAAFGETPGAPIISQSYSARTPTGWVLRSVNPPLDPVPGINASLPADFSADAATALWTGTGVPVGGGSPGTANLYRIDPAGTIQAISINQPPVVDGSFPPNPAYGGSADDASLVAFEMNTTPALTVTAGPTAPDGVNNAYAGNGTQLRLVSVLPNNTASPDGGTIGSSFTSKYNAVSDDGSRIFWNSTAFPLEVYVRINGTSTKHVSESERANPDPNGSQDKIYQYATPDGSSAFFTSGEKLTNNSQAEPGVPDLYRYDVDAGTLTDLTTGDPDGAGIQGVLGVSDNGNRVYFAASGDLAPGATDGQPNLYVRNGGTTTFITQLDTTTTFPNDSSNWSSSYGDKRARVTPDGEQLMFGSIGQQLGYDNAGFNEFYRYDLASDSFECLSCRPNGAPATANTILFSPPSGGLDLAGLSLSERRIFSADGATAFFTSPERLVGGDTNGKFDAYMWDEGDLDLVSTGVSSDNSAFVDASADGDDAFFLTRQQLVGIDTDNSTDLYDARVGGGIPEQNPPPPPPPCQGDDCQGPPPTQTDPQQPGTGVASGADGPGAGPDCSSFDQKATKSAAKAKQKKQKVKQLKKKGATKQKIKKAKQKAKQAKQQAKEDKQTANECHNA